MLSMIEVDNPAEFAQRQVHPRITAVRSLRDDAVGHLHARRQLGSGDEADARLARARLFQATWEMAGIGMIRSADLMASGRTDPSRRSGLNDRQKHAYEKIWRWCDAVGKPGFRLLVYVLIDKCTVAEASRRLYGDTEPATRTFTGRRLRECLDQL